MYSPFFIMNEEDWDESLEAVSVVDDLQDMFLLGLPQDEELIERAKLLGIDVQLIKEVCEDLDTVEIEDNLWE